MGFCFANLTRCLLAAGMALAVAYAAQAQHAARRPGQAILFSSADGEDVSSNMPSLAAKPPGMLDFANAVQSPPSAKSDAAPETELLPPQTPAISPAQAQQMQRLLDKRKNWALLTPEEIFNLPTPEKILHVPNRDAFGQPKNETVVGKFYERQEHLRDRTNNGNYGAADTAPRWGPSDNRDLQMNPNIWTPAGSTPGNLALMNQFLNGTTDNRAAPAPAPGQAPESGWSKPFSLPTPPPGPTTEQQAAMEQFQQLLKPHSLTDGNAKAPMLGSPIFSAPSTAPNPAPGSSVLIPVGASFTPLSSGIAMPAGVAPLPGLLGPTNMAMPMFEPEWKPQLPPWQSSAPQLGAIPQRKF